MYAIRSYYGVLLEHVAHARTIVASIANQVTVCILLTCVAVLRTVVENVRHPIVVGITKHNVQRIPSAGRYPEVLRHRVRVLLSRSYNFV